VTEAPQRVPGPGEFLVHTSSLNGLDGAVILAGTVGRIGEGAQLTAGKRVFGVAMKPVASERAFAEHVMADEGYGITAAPKELSLVRARRTGPGGLGRRERSRRVRNPVARREALRARRRHGHLRDDRP